MVASPTSYRSTSSSRLTRLSVRLALLLAGLLMVGLESTAQVIPDSTETETVEALLESVDEDAGDVTQLIDLLAALRENPLNVNVADAQDFAQIPGFDELVGNTIVAYRSSNGPFKSLPELQLVPGISEAMFISARPFLSIGKVTSSTSDRRRYPEVPNIQEIIGGTQFSVLQRVTRRLDLGRGYSGDTTRTTYAGGPERVYTRLRATYGRRVSLNFTGEKDPGELFLWNPEQRSFGYDHVTAHLALRDFGRVKNLVVGDYSLAYGQGLVFWKGLSAGKGRDVIGPATRSGNGISEYGSTDENLFLRGVASRVSITQSLSVSGFASRRTLDASIVQADTTFAGPFDGPFGNVDESSLTNTGLHRTDSERLKRDALTESLFGGSVEYTGNRLRLGAVAYSSTFDEPLVPGDEAYQRFRFSGSSIGIASIYGSAFMGSYQLFGEVARDQDGNVAASGGTSIRVGRTARAVVAARHYPRAYTNIHAFAFGESAGTTQNESGVYFGLQIQPARRWKLVTYFDQYRFPWVRFGVARPSSGYDALVSVEHRPTGWLKLYTQLRSETKEDGAQFRDAFGRLTESVQETTRQSARLNVDYEFSKQLVFRSRIEGARFDSELSPVSHGTLLSQDVRWRVAEKLMFDGRILFFDTDDYNSRLYAYEYDLRYAFSIPSFSGRGKRSYIMLVYNPVPSVELQIKYAVTKYKNVESVGSGLDEVEGNRLREIRAQMYWRF